MASRRNIWAERRMALAAVQRLRQLVALSEDDEFLHEIVTSADRVLTQSDLFDLSAPHAQGSAGIDGDLPVLAKNPYGSMVGMVRSGVRADVGAVQMGLGESGAIGAVQVKKRS